MKYLPGIEKERLLTNLKNEIKKIIETVYSGKRITNTEIKEALRTVIHSTKRTSIASVPFISHAPSLSKSPGVARKERRFGILIEKIQDKKVSVTNEEWAWALLKIILYDPFFYRIRNRRDKESILEKIETLTKEYAPNYTLFLQKSRKSIRWDRDRTLIETLSKTEQQEYTNLKTILKKLGKNDLTVYDEFLKIIGNKKSSLPMKAIASKQLGMQILNNKKRKSKNAARPYFLEALKIVREGEFKEGEAKLLELIGDTYFYEKKKKRYGKALDFYHDSVGIIRRVGTYEKATFLYEKMAECYHRQRQYVAARDYYNRSLEINEKIKSEKGIIIVIDKIAKNELAAGNREKAIEHYQDAMKKADALGDKKLRATLYGHFADCYVDATTGEEEELDYYLIWYKKKVKLLEELGIKTSVGSTLNRIGKRHFSKGNYKKAIKYFNKRLETLIEIEDNRLMPDVHEKIGDCYKELNKKKETVEHFRLALQLATEENYRPGKIKNIERKLLEAKKMSK
tara:strand:+ start:1624 stop:3162 length:1539 start_codon:yes stop_codon:yes gene_type:complete